MHFVIFEVPQFQNSSRFFNVAKGANAYKKNLHKTK